MSLLPLIVGLVAAMRLGELAYSARNARALKERGAVELGAGHYPLIIAVHAAWLLALFVFVPWDAAVHWLWLGVFLALLIMRVWTIASLGRFWTARVYSLPDAPLVRHGPYRFVAHPNYLVVAGEIAVLPLVFGAWRIALIFSILNAALLAWRIRVEERGLAPRRAVG
ncbi:MAG TPA: isoprenylcysteine carboxylmethyltransferase family protein [Stellaceae bacterium]|nr:isoprenylcysteine carboxylmethyltransferase family protein [Stellaceae bacterium]